MNELAQRPTRILLLALLLSVSVGCVFRSHSAPTVKPVPLGNRVELSDTGKVLKILYAQYGEWKGVPHSMGGMSKRGIDCSGFVYATFKSRLGLKLPRTAELLAEAGREISRANLRAGDLVFFDTGFFKDHVGIYLEKGKFLHVSSSKGVIISAMSNEYWSDAYWKAVRL